MTFKGNKKALARALFLKSMPTRYRSMFREAYTKRSLESAVHCFCLSCINFQVEEIKKCTSLTCPLYEYRTIEDV